MQLNDDLLPSLPIVIEAVGISDGDDEMPISRRLGIWLRFDVKIFVILALRSTPACTSTKSTKKRAKVNTRKRL